VKGFVGRSPASAESKLLRRLALLRFEPDPEGERIPAVWARFRHSAEARAFRGKLGETRVWLRLAKGRDLELRLTFTPRVSFRRASKLIARLGVRGLEGAWT
jgi:hypothetical protein